MQRHDLIQGSPEWLAHRATCWNASDAPAMLGCSPYKNRAQLLKECATGITEDVDAGTQRLFDAGHRFEALARPLAEAIVEEDLSPLSGTVDVGLSRPLAASFDGITFMGDTVFEHKTLNDSLRYTPWDQGNGDHLPLHFRAQMEHQLIVSGAVRALFMATKWAGEECTEKRYCWYVSDPELRAQILAGWKQFEADVAAYQPAEVMPQVVAEPVEALPAVLVKVSGEIAITANFTAFETKLRDFLDNRLIREPKTDQDFADLDLQIKAMKGAEAALESAEAQMLAQIQSVDTAKRTKDMLHKLVRDNRLMAEKLLASEKERRKAEIVGAGQAKLREHIAGLTKRLGFALPPIAADIAGSIKGKKSLTSMEDAISTELARAKIAASQVADLIDGNRKAMEAADAAGLFPDFASVCTKPADDFANLITSRRAAAEQRLQAERERIRAEEAARLEREQRAAEQARAEAAAKLEREQREEAERQARELQEARERSERADAERRMGDAVQAAQARVGIDRPYEVYLQFAGGHGNKVPDERVSEYIAALDSLQPESNTPEQGAQQVLKAEAPEPDATDRDAPASQGPSVGSMGARATADAAPSVEYTLASAPPCHQTQVPTLSLGTIKERIAPLSITADGLAALGFEATKVKATCLYHEADWDDIKAAMRKVLA